VTAPVRVQLSRAKGWRMPPNTVKVDRSTPYGNPWKIVGPNEYRRLWWVQGPRADVECSSEAEAAALSLRKFRYYAETHPGLLAALRGKNVGCWCGLDRPCHGDIWLELANPVLQTEGDRR
jgi:hypothetical protein